MVQDENNKAGKELGIILSKSQPKLSVSTRFLNLCSLCSKKLIPDTAIRCYSTARNKYNIEDLILLAFFVIPHTHGDKFSIIISDGLIFFLNSTLLNEV